MIYYEFIFCDIVLKTEVDKGSRSVSPTKKQEEVALERSTTPADDTGSRPASPEKQEEVAAGTKSVRIADDPEITTIYNEFNETDDGLVLDPPRLSKSAQDSKQRKLRHSSIGPQMEVPKLSELHELLTGPLREILGFQAEQSWAQNFLRKSVTRL